MPRIIEGTSMNITGEKIKYYRKMRKLSQQQLSDKYVGGLFPESRTVHEQLQILNFMDYQRYFKCRLKSFLNNKQTEKVHNYQCTFSMFNNFRLS